MNNKTGFTLTEMLTVVLIIGVLTAVALPQYQRAVQKAHATEAVSMLRVILDSSERLSAAFGYRTFGGFLNASNTAGSDVAGKATFNRMDMFNEDELPCTISSDGKTLTCDRYRYTFTGGYVSAVKRTRPYQGLEFRLSRADVPTLSCGASAGSSLSATTVTEACDLFGMDTFE